MIRRFPSYVCVFLWVLAACGGSRCDGGKASTPQRVPDDKPQPAAPLPVIKPPRADLRLVVLTDPLGYLEPCGCQQRPLGGLDKLATVVGEARATGVPTLLLSAGDFAMGVELRPEDADEALAQEGMRAKTFVQIWRDLAPAAITPGPLDLTQNAQQLSALTTLSGFPWLVDNAAPSPKGSAPLSHARIVEVSGHKVGLLGLVAPSATSLLGAGTTLSNDLSKLASEQSAALRAQGAELVVALVSADRRSARQLGSQGPDVVLLGGLHLEEPLTPTVAGRAVLLHAGQQGQYVVTVDLGLGGADAGAASAWEDGSNWTRRTARADLELQIRERRERIEAWQKDPKTNPADLSAQRERLRELEAERDQPGAPTFAGRWFYADLVALAPEVPGARDVGNAIDAHDMRVNEHNRVSLANRLPLPAPPGTASYAGSESCASCHQQAYDWWRGTKHGHAYATLENVHKEFNLSCVGCHVVGYNKPGGSTVTHVDKLKDVGCESCHGPGSLHNAEPKLPNLIARQVPEATCTTCHTHEHSDRFEYSAFRQMLIVPGHGKPADRQ